MGGTPDFVSLNRLPERTLVALMSVAIVLVILHIGVNFCWVTQSCGGMTQPVNDLGYLFDLNTEMNVPTWFSIIILFLVSVTTIPIVLDYRRKGEATLGWWGIFFIFLLLSLDEESDLHGFLTKLMKHPDGMGFQRASFSWVIPAAVIVLVVGAAYLRWVFRLPKRTCWLVILAGTIYVGGALVMEAIGGLVADKTFLTPGYLAIATTEELFEMTGVSLMIYALLDLARQRRIAFSF